MSRTNVLSLGAAALLLAAGLSWIGHRMTNDADDPRLTTLVDAVADRNIAAVRRLTTAGAPLNERDETGATPLMTACGTGQFRIAELLIAAGADVFAANRFGATAGRMAWVSRISHASEEGQARQRVIDAMRARGFPFPAPDRAEVAAAIAAGRWPPRR